MSFDSSYIRDNQIEPLSLNVSKLAKIESGAPGLMRFVSEHAGISYNNGLYRIHTVENMNKWTEIVSEVFPQFHQKIFCFSCDWLGRNFALDFSRKVQGRFLVLMLEPGTGQALEIPANFMEFHDVELVQHHNEALASDFYLSWLSTGGKAPLLAECVSYRKPMFLGGKDIVSNLELTDMEVYWAVVSQLQAKVRELPGGTRIGKIGIGE